MNLVIILCIFLILANAAQMQQLEISSEIAAKDRAENKCKAVGNMCSSDCECCSGHCTFSFRRRLPIKFCENRYDKDEICDPEKNMSERCQKMICERKCWERCSDDK